MFSAFSRHKIRRQDEIPFSPDAYSRFKYGDFAIAQSFGDELFEGFLDEWGARLSNYEKIVLLPSPYGHIPTASFYLARSFERRLNAHLACDGKRAIVLSKIHRNKTYTTDYGALSREERINLIKNDTYHVDREMIQGGLVLLIDDIKITGSHEHVIRKLIERQEIDGDFVFLYFAELTNPDMDPAFENFLNYHFVQNLDHVQEIIERGHFRFNTRVVKFILSQPRDTFQRFIESNPTEIVSDLANYGIGNNYHLMPEYGANLLTLIQESATTVSKS